jgi:hypothetical protein
MSSQIQGLYSKIFPFDFRQKVSRALRFTLTQIVKGATLHQTACADDGSALKYHRLPRPPPQSALRPMADDDVDLASLASSQSDASKERARPEGGDDDISPIPSPRSSLSRLSITSFSYTDMLFPLTASAEDPSGNARLEKMKTVTYWSGLSLVVGLQIGSGIFSSPALVNRNAGSVGMSLIVWIVAGCLAWTGACTSSLLEQNR